MTDYMQNERHACHDCGHDTDALGEYYMIDDDLWCDAIAGDWAHMLCVGCVEHRLGRRLAADDFTHAPVNGEYGKSLRLKQRLRATT